MNRQRREERMDPQMSQIDTDGETNDELNEMDI